MTGFSARYVVAEEKPRYRTRWAQSHKGYGGETIRGKSLTVAREQTDGSWTDAAKARRKDMAKDSLTLDGREGIKVEDRFASRKRTTNRTVERDRIKAKVTSRLIVRVEVELNQRRG